jgi:hypothetical protein
MDLLQQNINLQPKKAEMFYGMVDWMKFTEPDGNDKTISSNQSPQEYYE